MVIIADDYNWVHLIRSAALYLKLIFPFFKKSAWNILIQLSHSIATIYNRFHYPEIKSNTKDYFWQPLTAGIAYTIYF